jgi:hypothetical protein
MTLFAMGCSPASSRAATQSPADLPQSKAPVGETAIKQYTVAEVEYMAGFDVKEPTYLPAGVSLEFATYETSPSPAVTLHFKIVHEQFGDMGQFFLITQQPEKTASPDTISCGEMTEGCEVLQINNVPVVYNSYTGGTEGLNWLADGFAFRFLRTAGEPNKVYKGELVKVIESME